MLIFVLLFLLLVIVAVSWIFLINDAKKLAVPGPLPLPLVGNGLLFLGNSTKFLNTLRDFSINYGNILRIHILSNRYLLISDPKYVEAVTSKTELITKGRSYDFLHPWLGQGLNSIRWKTHRKFLTPAFHFNILQNFLPVFLKNEKVLLEKLRSYADGQSFDLFPLIALAALDNVTESIMGVSFHAQTDSESKYVKSIDDLSTLTSTRMRNPFLAVHAIFNLLPHRAVQDKAIKILHEHSERVIEARRQELEKTNITSLNYNSDFGIKNRHAFLDLLLLAEMDGKRIDRTSIREEVDTFMFEGHDTTTSGIVFSLYCISKHTEVQEKILKELKSIFGDDRRDPTYSEVQQMTYLEMVIKESLRLYPSVPLIERITTRDTDVAGLLVPKDTAILIDIFHMHRDPNIYENPLEFRPERFESVARNAFIWLPFSAGPRNCIGQKFAMLEMKVTIAAIVQNFKILPSHMEPILGAELVLRSRNGVHIKLASR